MAVAFDAQDTNAATAATNVDITFTVGAGSNRGLVVQVAMKGTGVAGLAATWDNGGSNQAMDLLRQEDSPVSGAQSVALFGLVNPASGNKTLRVSWTGSRDAVAGAVAYTGVDQTGGTTSFPNATGASGSSTTPSVTVSSAVDDAVVAVHCTDSASVTAVNNTQVFVDDTRPDISTGGNRAGGAASVNMTATINASQRWTSAGVSVKASVAGGSSNAVAWLRA